MLPLPFGQVDGAGRARGGGLGRVGRAEEGGQGQGGRGPPLGRGAGERGGCAFELHRRDLGFMMLLHPDHRHLTRDDREGGVGS